MNGEAEEAQNWTRMWNFRSS